MSIKTLSQAIKKQAEINKFLAQNGIKDLVGDYGELLAYTGLGGKRENAVNQGYDILHSEFGRIEVKTRKYEMLQSGAIRKENRAVGFKGKENGFDHLLHIVLDVDFSIVSACLCKYQDVWSEIEKTTGKVSYSKSSSLPSSIDITNELKAAQQKLGFE
ncbi:hypothetical protein [Shewanella sp.]|uniref:hypothetical protein n=1 Tax=Shewanella sp. TaxID=50422 RepID=UPI0040481D5D